MSEAKLSELPLQYVLKINRDIYATQLSHLMLNLHVMCYIMAKISITGVKEAVEDGK